MENEESKIYKCPECGLSYVDKEMAVKCEEWCKKHKTCNVEIIKHSVEHKKHDN